MKQFISKNFDMKDRGEASYVIGIKIHRERSQGIMGLSQALYQQSFREILDERLFTEPSTHSKA